MTGGDARLRLKGLDTNGSATVIVPVRPRSAGEQHFLEVEHDGGASDPAARERFARCRLSDATTALHDVGFDRVEGQTTDRGAVTAIESAAQTGDFDAVVVVTGPVGPSSWVHLDLASRIDRHIDQPVIHFELDPVQEPPSRPYAESTH